MKSILLLFPLSVSASLWCAVRNVEYLDIYASNQSNILVGGSRLSACEDLRLKKWNDASIDAASCASSLPLFNAEQQMIAVTGDGVIGTLQKGAIPVPCPAADGGVVYFYTTKPTCPEANDGTLFTAHAAPSPPSCGIYTGSSSPGRLIEPVGTFTPAHTLVFDTESFLDTPLHSTVRKVSIPRTDARVTDKVFKQNKWGKSVSLPDKSLDDLFGSNDILFLEYGSEWCWSCKLVTNGIIDAQSSVVKADLYKKLKNNGVSVAEFLDMEEDLRGILLGENGLPFQIDANGDPFLFSGNPAYTREAGTSMTSNAYFAAVNPESLPDYSFQSLHSPQSLMEIGYPYGTASAWYGDTALAGQATDVLSYVFGEASTVTAWALIERSAGYITILGRGATTALAHDHISWGAAYGPVRIQSGDSSSKLFSMAGITETMPLVGSYPPMLTKKDRCDRVLAMKCSNCVNGNADCKQDYVDYWAIYNCCDPSVSSDTSLIGA